MACVQSKKFVLRASMCSFVFLLWNMQKRGRLDWLCKSNTRSIQAMIQARNHGVWPTFRQENTSWKNLKTLGSLLGCWLLPQLKPHFLELALSFVQISIILRPSCNDGASVQKSFTFSLNEGQNWVDARETYFRFYAPWVQRMQVSIVCSTCSR